MLYLLHYGETRFQVPHFQSIRPIASGSENIIQEYVANLPTDKVQNSTISSTSTISRPARAQIGSIPEETADFELPILQSSCLPSEHNLSSQRGSRLRNRVNEANIITEGSRKKQRRL